MRNHEKTRNKRIIAKSQTYTNQTKKHGISSKQKMVLTEKTKPRIHKLFVSCLINRPKHTSVHAFVQKQNYL